MNRPSEYQEIWKQRLKERVQPEKRLVLDTAEDSVKYLTDCLGELTGYVAAFSGRNLTIHDSSLGQLKYRTSFREGQRIVDVDYLQLKCKRFACVVAVHCPAEQRSFIALLIAPSRSNTIQLFFARQISLQAQVTCLKTVLSESDEIYLSRCHSKIREMRNVIAVGTTRPHCYIFGLKEVDVNDAELGQVNVFPPAESIRMQDALRSNIENEQFVLLTKHVDEHSALRVPVIQAAVSCIGFFIRSSILVIGLRFGGLQIVHLNGELSLYSFSCDLSQPIRALVNCEPDDDPRKHEHMLVVSTGDRATLTVCLIEASPLSADEQPNAHDESGHNIFIHATFKTRVDQVRRFISARALVIRRMEDDSQPQSRISADSSHCSRSFIYFTYIGTDSRKEQLMLGLFDMNMYYFKRIPHALIFDQTAAHQCPFLAPVYGPASQTYDYLTTKDLIIHSDAVDKFSSPCNDSDQLFYASALDFNFVSLVTASGSRLLSIPSLPAQALTHLSINLRDCLDRAVGSAHVETLGLLSKSTLERIRENYTDNLERSRATLLNALLYNATAESVKALQSVIRYCDWELCSFVLEWIWREIELAKKTLDDRVSGLFDREVRPLGPEGESSLVLVRAVFAMAISIYEALSQKQTNEEDKEIIPQSVTAGVHSLRQNAARRLFEYCQLLDRLLTHNFIPFTGEIVEKLNKMKARVEEERQRYGQLAADELVSKMQGQTKEEALWLDYAPQKWYPPALGNLLQTILLPKVSRHHKQKLIIYYFADFFSANSSNENEDVPAEVFKMLETILRIDRHLVESMLKGRKEMLRQQREQAGERETGEVSEERTISREAKMLMESKTKLSPAEEERLKVLIRQLPYGEYRYQLYLVMANRLSEFNPNLSIDNPSTVVQHYAAIVKGLRKDGRVASDVKGRGEPQAQGQVWGKDVLEKIRAGQSLSLAEAESSLAKKFVPKTPRALWNKQRMSMVSSSRTQQSPPSVSAVNASSPVDPSPESAIRSVDSTPKHKMHRLAFDEEDSTQPDHDIPSEEKERVNQLLATPRERAQRAHAAQATHRLSFERTPPQDHNRAPPRTPASILKSGRRPDASPGRGRIKFDLPNLTASSVEESLISASSAPIQRPDFDVEMEVAGAETTNEDKSIPIINDSSSMESIVVSSPTADGTLPATPPTAPPTVANVTVTLSSRDDAESPLIERSFEQQPEDDEEVEPAEEAEKVQETAEIEVVEEEDEYMDAEDGMESERDKAVKKSAEKQLEDEIEEKQDEEQQIHERTPIHSPKSTPKKAAATPPSSPAVSLAAVPAHRSPSPAKSPITRRVSSRLSPSRAAKTTAFASIHKSPTRSLSSTSGKESAGTSTQDDSVAYLIQKKIDGHPIAKKLPSAALAEIKKDPLMRAVTAIQLERANRGKKQTEMKARQATSSSAIADRVNRDEHEEKAVQRTPRKSQSNKAAVASPTRRSTRKRSLSEQVTLAVNQVLAPLPVQSTPSTPHKRGGRQPKSAIVSEQKTDEDAAKGKTQTQTNVPPANPLGLRRSARKRTPSETIMMNAQTVPKADGKSGTSATRRRKAQEEVAEQQQNTTAETGPSHSGLRRSMRKRTVSGNSNSQSSKPASPAGTPKRPKRKAPTATITEEDE